VTVAGILISSVKVPAALTLAEVIDLAGSVDRRCMTGVSQTVGHA